MNFETIDWIIIVTLVILILIVFNDHNSEIEVREHLSTAALQQLDALIQEAQTRISQIDREINEKRNEERSLASNPFQIGPISNSLNRVRNEIRRLEENKARMSQMINQYEAIKASGIQTNQQVQSLNNQVSSLDNQINSLDNQVNSLQEENNLLKTANDNLQNQLNAAQNAARTLTNQNTDELVEAAVTKITEDIMSRTEGMNWEQMATRVGSAVEEQIKEFGQQYQTMDKDVLAQRLGEQAGKMIDDILDSMEEDIADLNNPTPLNVGQVNIPVVSQPGNVPIYNSQ